MIARLSDLVERARATVARRRTAGASGPLLASGAVTGPVPWVIAIMTALTVAAAAAGMALGGVASRAGEELAGGITVQIAGPASARAAAQADAAMKALTRAPEVSAVRRLSVAERTRLLEPWLGEDNGAGDLLPLPELIEARLTGEADAAAIAALRTRLGPVAPDARVEASGTWLKPIGDAIAALQWLAVALVVLLASATAAAVLLASRSALAANRATISILHLLGAEDRQIAAQFQRAAGFSAALGGAAGFAVAELIILVIADRFAALGPTGGDAGLRWHDWLTLAAIPVGGVLLAILVARLTVLAALRKMP